MKKTTRIVDIGLVVALLLVISVPLFAVTAPSLGAAAGYTILDINTLNASQARADAQNAYNQLLAMQCTADMTHQELNNQRLAPGVYCMSGNQDFQGQVLLDAKGDPNAVYVFKTGNTFTAWPDSRVLLLGGTQPQNVFWHVGGKTIIGTSADFAGTVVGFDSITFGRGAENPVFDERGTVNGRLWSIGSTVTVPSQVAIGFQSAPVIIPAVPFTVTQPAPTQAGTVGWLTVTQNDPNFALFVNGYRVQSGQAYPFVPGTYIVSEVNVSGIEYANPVWGGACASSGLNGIVALNVGEQKICTVTNASYSYNYSTVAFAPSYIPTLPNTGHGGVYLPFLNAAGFILIGAFIIEEALTMRRVRAQIVGVR